MKFTMRISNQIQGLRKDRKTGLDIPGSEHNTVVLNHNGASVFVDVPLDAPAPIIGHLVDVEADSISAPVAGTPYNRNGTLVQGSPRCRLEGNVRVGLATTQRPPEPAAVF
jgi:hypothetical protein